MVRGTPPARPQTTPVPNQLVHCNTRRRSTPAALDNFSRSRSAISSLLDGVTDCADPDRALTGFIPCRYGDDSTCSILHPGNISCAGKRGSADAKCRGAGCALLPGGV